MSTFAAPSICICFAVGEDEIVDWIRRGATSVDEIGASCLAGQGCGDCRGLLEELLADFATEARPDQH
ncbi:MULTISPECIES: (2Fe-2S)-binding protein [unclassified Kitasatospora]|uniref:(2Fe-2S)-binding protein n=1 Tax=unclassified Kitasatospora TaxID=2633591 RepID=UPI0033E39E60